MEMSDETLAKYPSVKKLHETGDFGVMWGDGREVQLLEFIYNHPNLVQIRGSPGKLAAAIDEFSYQDEFLINIGDDKARIVTTEIQQRKPRVFVECGGYVGYSAIVFADAMRRARPGEKVEYWSLEFDPLYASIAMNFIRLAGLDDIVKVETGAADESIKRLKGEGKIDHIDIFFLDHLEDLYIQDLKTCESLGLLKSGSCIMADNVKTPGAPEYKEYVKSHPHFTTRAEKGLIMPGELDDEVEITVVG